MHGDALGVGSGLGEEERKSEGVGARSAAEDEGVGEGEGGSGGEVVMGAELEEDEVHVAAYESGFRGCGGRWRGGHLLRGLAGG